MRDRKNAPVFVVGCPRSGTTLLYHMLLSAGDFAIYRTESHVFSTLAPRFGNLRTRYGRARMMDRWLASDLFRLTGLEAEQIHERVLKECHNGGQFLSVVMESMARQQNVVRWAENTPNHLLQLDEVKRTIPDALIVHIIRDGRNVAASLHRQGWIHPLLWDRDKGPLAAALFWEWMVRRGRESGQRFGPDYFEVRYEDLVRDPRATMQRLGQFVEHNLDYDRILQVGVGSVRSPNTSFADSPSNVADRWKQHLQPKHGAMIEEAIGPFLRELGYQVSHRPRARATRFLYHAYLNLKWWVRMQTPLGRFLISLDILRPGRVTGHTRSLSWPGADAS